MFLQLKMISLAIVAALAVMSHVICEEEIDTDSDIFPYVINALKELQLRRLLEESGIQQGPTAFSICYGDLGCFDKNGTFKHLKQLPDAPEVVGTRFLLYTRKNPFEPQIIDHDKPETVLRSNLDGSLPLKFITHGFGGRNNLTWVWNMKNAFLERENVNVIVVDWSLGARAPYYIQAVVNTELVGAQISVLYFFIKENYGILEKDLHVIGFSLGAQVSGFVGKRMFEMRGTRPSRITGLDPAGPLFETYGEDVHLFKDDADFVDVIHTNADLALYGGVGMGTAIGHVDYYPNGGKRQPGCGSTLTGVIKDIFKKDRQRACNHERAVLLFTESILNPTSCKFVSFPCNEYEDLKSGKCLQCTSEKPCGVMGYSGYGSGTYYLMTKKDQPYCTAAAKLSVGFAKNIKKSHGAIIITLVGHDGEKEEINLTSKDEKLVPGTVKEQAIILEKEIQTLKEIHVLYQRYSGWIVKGAPSYALSSIAIVNASGNYIFRSCKNVVLDTNIPAILTEKDTGC